MKVFNKQATKEVRSDYVPENYPLLPLSDPAVLEYFGINQRSLAGICVSEESILGIPAVYRSVSLISSTIAGLPLKTYRDAGGKRTEITSFLDDPGLDLLTEFEWMELCLVHLLVHGNAFFIKVFNGGGALSGLQPVHPSLVHVAWDKELMRKVYKVNVESGAERVYTDDNALHIKGLGTDSLVGLAPLSLHRLSLATGIAGNEAAGNMFANGLMIQGMIVAEATERLTEEQARMVKEDVESRMQGSRNAGRVPVVNKALKFVPMTQVSRDAQFIESRAFQIEEIARIFGLPPHLLAQTEKQTSFGAGLGEQNLGLQKYVLKGWTTRIEQRLTRLLPRPQFVEFEYAGLLQGTPTEEITLLALQVEKGLLTIDEARAIRNLPPLSDSELSALNPPPPIPPKEDPNAGNPPSV